MRVKRGVATHAKHKKLFRANKGYRMTKRRLTSVAKEAYLHAGEYAFAGRKNRKRDFRQMWISKIGQATKLQGLSYSMFIHNMKALNITLDRKILSNLVVDNPEVFDAIISKAKSVN